MKTKVSVVELASIGAAMYARSGGDVRAAIRYACELVGEAERVLEGAPTPRIEEKAKRGGVMTSDSMREALQ